MFLIGVSSPENNINCVFITLEWAIYMYRWVLFHGAHNVSTVAQMDKPNTDSGGGAFVISECNMASVGFTTGSVGEGEWKDILLVAICNLTTRCQ